MRSRLPALALTATLSIAGAGALAQAEAERRLDAAIERLRTALGPDGRLTIASRSVDPLTGQAMLTDVVLTQGPDRLAIPELHLAGLSDTRIGRAEAHRATYQGRDGARGEISRALVSGLALPPPGEAIAPETIRIGGLEIEALRMAVAEKHLTLERLTLADASPAGIGAGLLQGFAFRDTGQARQQARIGRIEIAALTLPLKGDAFDPLAFRAGRIALDQASLQDGGQRVQLAIGRLALTDWLPGRTMTLLLEGFEAATPSATGLLGLRLAALESSGIDGPGTLAATLGERQAPDPLPGRPQRAELRGLEAQLDGAPVALLARLATESSLEGGLLAGALVLEGLRVIPPRGQADWLAALGYREIAGGSELRASAVRAGGRLEVAPFRIALDQAGRLDLALRAERMPATPAAGEPIAQGALLAGLMEAELGALTLSYRDQGFFGRLVTMQARQQRIPEARLREQWAQLALVMPVPAAGPERPAQRDRAKPAPPQAAPAPPSGKAKIGMPDAPAAPAEAGDPFAPMRQALAAFIRQPGTLEVALRPPRPLRFVEISAMQAEPPAESLRRLGFSLTHR